MTEISPECITLCLYRILYCSSTEHCCHNRYTVKSHLIELLDSESYPEQRNTEKESTYQTLYYCPMYVQSASPNSGGISYQIGWPMLTTTTDRLVKQACISELSES